MYEHEKDLRLLTIFPFTILLAGILLLQISGGFKASSFTSNPIPYFILSWVIFGFNGLMGVLYELKVMVKQIEIIEQDPEYKWPVDRGLILRLYIFISFIIIAYVTYVYVINGYSKDALLSPALNMILCGSGFTLTFGMMLVCIAVIRFIRYRRQHAPRAPIKEWKL